jgi:hypothetical protein
MLIDKGRRFLIGALGLTLTGAGVRRYHAKPQRLCGIPNADYQPPQPPPAAATVVAVSEVGLPLAQLPPLRTVDPAADSLITSPSFGQSAAEAVEAMNLLIDRESLKTKPRVKVYQFPTAGLAVDHCSISQIAFFMQEDGTWRLNLNADQNAGASASRVVTGPTTLPQVRGLPDITIKETSFLKRNLFVIRLRGLGSYTEPLPTPPVPSVVGKPVLLALPPIRFWVQRGVTYPLVSSGRHPDAARFFDEIDRAQVEFTYH